MSCYFIHESVLLIIYYLLENREVRTNTRSFDFDEEKAQERGESCRGARENSVESVVAEPAHVQSKSKLE
jgi:hypothetical protein